MKEAIGGTWIFQIVIFFILVFTGFMCLSINRSKAFNVKDQIIQTIQSYNGINVNGQYNEDNIDAFYDIVEYIKGTSYRNTGVFPKAEKVGDETVEYTCFNREGKTTTKNPTFCIAPINTSKEVCSSSNCELPEMVYYRVMVFYQLDLPIFHEWFNFQVVGDTKTLYRGAA